MEPWAASLNHDARQFILLETQDQQQVNPPVDGTLIQTACRFVQWLIFLIFFLNINFFITDQTIKNPTLKHFLHWLIHQNSESVLYHGPSSHVSSSAANSGFMGYLMLLTILEV